MYIYPHSHASLCHFADKEAIFVAKFQTFIALFKVKKRLVNLHIFHQYINISFAYIMYAFLLLFTHIFFIFQS